MWVGRDGNGNAIINISASSSLPNGSGWGPLSGSAAENVALTNIPRYANLTSLSVKSATLDSITIQYTTDKLARLYIRFDDTSWLNNGNPFVENTTGGEITIAHKNREATERLDPNTLYGITVLCRTMGIDLDTSRRIEGRTLDIARITSVTNIDFEEDVSLRFSNLNNGTTKLIVKIADTEICTRENLTSSYTLSFTKEELSKMIKLLSDETTEVTYTVVTNEKYSATAKATITLKANIYIKKDGVWLRAKLLKKDESWKLTKVFFKTDGIWRNTR